MNEPLEQLQFTEEEIEHAVREFHRTVSRGDTAAETVRAVLRAVRAVPARCLNGHLSGQPAPIGSRVRGTGVNGRTVRGVVLVSYPVTTTVCNSEGVTDYLWTNTIRSWDSSTDAVVIGPPGTGKYRTLAELGVRAPDGDYLRADDDGMAVEADR